MSSQSVPHCSRRPAHGGGYGKGLRHGGLVVQTSIYNRTLGLAADSISRYKINSMPWTVASIYRSVNRPGCRAARAV